MLTLQIPDLDQTTVEMLRQWAADHGRTLEDEARVVLQRVVTEAACAPSDRETPLQQADVHGRRNGNDAELTRGAASLQPMTLSPEDAAIMQEAWEKGLARPTMPVVALPQYEG